MEDINEIIHEESDEEMNFGTPPDVAEAALNVSNNLLPEKSKVIYEKRYNQFLQWCMSKKIQHFSENVLLGYFSQELNHLKSSSLWAIYSMLKTTLNTRKNVDISKYHKLIAYLKKKSHNHCPKKSKTLDLHQIKSFITDAPDTTYLMKKVSQIEKNVNQIVDLNSNFRWLLFSEYLVLAVETNWYACS